MTQIRLEKVSYGHTEPLFEDVSLSISTQDRIGIVGDNGSGKSTFMQCIAGQITDYKGTISKPKKFKFSYIEQDIPDDIQNETLHDVIASNIPADERDYNLWKVDMALDLFKAPGNIRNKPIHQLSGGWQRLALIARSSNV